MENKAFKSDAKAREKKTISKLRTKVDPAHPKYMGEPWLSSPDGQGALRRIAAYDPGRATPGRSTTAAKLAIRKQLDGIKATGEATKANTDDLLLRAQGKIPEKLPDQTAGERVRELDMTLVNVPALRAERKQMAKLSRQHAAEQRPPKRRRTGTASTGTPGAAAAPSDEAPAPESAAAAPKRNARARQQDSLKRKTREPTAAHNGLVDPVEAAPGSAAPGAPSLGTTTSHWSSRMPSTSERSVWGMIARALAEQARQARQA